MKKIFWAGDSTVAYNSILTYPQTGIGQVFHLFLQEDAEIINHAINGRSTKSFIDQGRLAVIAETIGKGDFLFIQFGHNDEKIEDSERYTNPFKEYKENLGKFVAAAYDKGAYPVLITPLERRCFADDGQLEAGEHTDYVTAMKQTADEMRVPLVDLYSKSREELIQVGAEETRKWYMHLAAGEFVSKPEGLTDNTHLQYTGAVTFGRCIAEGLKELGGIYRELLLEGY